jgi:hypothetical protein
LEQISPAVVTIDPTSSVGGRALSPAVVLRACSVVPGLTVSEPVTHTYVFAGMAGVLSPEGVVPGPQWPSNGFLSQAMDYGMSPVILNDPRYAGSITAALLDVPTLSIATDPKHLFGADSGIYVHAMMDGREWERPASVELLRPDGGQGFAINCGIRIRGGWSRHGDNPKHAFRFFFRGEYGSTKLNYPLFGTEGATEFDKVDLRTAQNYSWSYPGHLGSYNTMISDVFCRDVQGAMGQPYTRSRAYHLYLNGVYWGLYQTQERPEAKYGETYFGGSDMDYDVVKNSDSYTIEATDGNLDAYRELWNACVAGFTDTRYRQVQGLAPDGSRDVWLRVLLDVDNLIDYMINIFYSGNFDSPTSKFGNNKSVNNFYAVFNRKGASGFKFFVHDAEHTLRTTEGEGPGIGLAENRVNIGTMSGPDLMVVNDFSSFHPQWLHHRLSSHAEYRMRFADRAYRHFYNGGPLTPQRATAMFLSRAREIDTAVIGESARWGNTYLDPPATRDNTWRRAVDDIVQNYFPFRSIIVLSQLRSASLYPTIQPPLFMSGQDTVVGASIRINGPFPLTLRREQGMPGTIYYSLDNRDPRAFGGSIGPSAIAGDSLVELSTSKTVVVKARVLDGTTWSALHELVLYSNDNVRDLKVTEIHYHPLAEGIVSGNEYEFLEIKNIGTLPVNLSQATFTDGITYTFPSGASVEPGAFIVLASNASAFKTRYGFTPYGEYEGQLDNSGERFTLKTATGDTIISLQYDDASPWPVAPDTDGSSLVPVEVDPSGVQQDPAQWRASLSIGGSPGRDDMTPAAVSEKDDNVPAEVELRQNYPNPFNPVSMIDFGIPVESRVTITIHDLLGRTVATLMDDVQRAGFHSVPFVATNLASGVYLVRLQCGPTVRLRKAIVMK